MFSTQQQFNSNPFARGTYQERRNQQEHWKSDAFINIRLPRSDGKEFTVDSLKLKLSNRFQAQLIEYFNQDLEAAEKWFRENIIIDFRMADDESGASLAIPAISK